jgi:hypothetical protein
MRLVWFVTWGVAEGRSGGVVGWGRGWQKEATVVVEGFGERESEEEQ